MEPATRSDSNTRLRGQNKSPQGAQASGRLRSIGVCYAARHSWHEARWRLRIQPGRSPGSRINTIRAAFPLPVAHLPDHSPITVTSSRGIFTRFPFHRTHCARHPLCYSIIPVYFITCNSLLQAHGILKMDVSVQSARQRLIQRVCMLEAANHKHRRGGEVELFLL